MDRQEFWENNYKYAKEKGYSTQDAELIADMSLSDYVEESKEIVGSRSIAMDSNYLDNGDYLDILVGYVDSGLEDGLNDSLDSSGFENFDKLETKADLEHYNFDLSLGVGNDLDEKWQHFAIDSEMYKKNNEIRAKIKPSTDLDKEFIDEYKKGVYGASIEYKGIKNGNNINNWEITGFSFTKNPHYHQTKPKNTKN